MTPAEVLKWLEGKGTRRTVAGMSRYALLDAFAQNTTASTAAPGDVIAAAKDAVNVFDFEAVARKNLPPAHFGYLASGDDDDLTLRANREGFQKFQLRPRRLVDVGRLDTRMELFGETYGSPIVVAPTGSNAMVGLSLCTRQRIRWPVSMARRA